MPREGAKRVRKPKVLDGEDEPAAKRQSAGGSPGAGSGSGSADSVPVTAESGSTGAKPTQRVPMVARVLWDAVFQGAYTAPVVDLTGKKIAVTGPSKGGIGYDMALAFAAMGADVLLLARNKERAEASMVSIREAHPAAKVSFVECDVNSLKSVHKCIKELSSVKLDVLVSNAGAQHDKLEYNEDGCEVTFSTLCMGHHLLAAKLMPTRLVWISGDIYCMADKKAVVGPKNAIKSKEVRYFTGSLGRFWLARMWQKHGGKEMVVVHPGVIASEFLGLTGLGRRVQNSLLIDSHLGAQPGIYAATCPVEEIPNTPVPYFHNKYGWYPLPETDQAMDEERAETCWKECNEFCGL